MKKVILLLLCSLVVSAAWAIERQKLNFNGGWLLSVGDTREAASLDYDDADWQQVTLPYAFNGDEAFRKDIVDLTDTIAWYRKHFSVSALKGKRCLLSSRVCAKEQTSI